MRPRLRYGLFAFAVASAFRLLVQSASAQPALSPRTLILKARTADMDKGSRTRYTYFELSHLENRFRKGRPIFHLGNLFVNTTTLYESTWIGDLPYLRVVEFQGKLLTGDALAKEQARYDQAVAQHKGLGRDARARILHQKLVKSNINLADLLTPAYSLTELRQETIAGSLTHVIDCVPAPSADPLHTAATEHLQIWVTDSGAILRKTFDVIADEPEMLRGGHGEFDFQLIDGNLLPKHDLLHFDVPRKGSIITVDVENTYTRFRRFNVSSTIVPAGDSQLDRPQ